MRLLMITLVLAVLAIACGVAIEGRIDVGERHPRTPCPQAEP
jgi:hypothetical protein